MSRPCSKWAASSAPLSSGSRPCAFGVVEQPVGGEGVRHHQAVEVERQPLPRCRVGDVGDHRQHLVAGHPLALDEVVDLPARVMGRQRGVELVTAVGHVDGLPELRHGPLEPHLPDVAPRTRDVGPDLNLHAKVKAAGGVELFPSVLAKPLHVLSPMLLSIDTSTARQ